MLSTYDLNRRPCGSRAILGAPGGKIHGGKRGFRRMNRISVAITQRKNNNAHNGLLEDIAAYSTTDKVGKLGHDLKLQTRYIKPGNSKEGCSYRSEAIFFMFNFLQVL
jgi:hypothetical protein